MESKSLSSIWAITACFNPNGYRRRLTNFRVFRQRLGVPLVAVERAYSGQFELTASDADIEISRSSILIHIKILHLMTRMSGNGIQPSRPCTAICDPILPAGRKMGSIHWECQRISAGD
jgi:hypothetical protein